LLKGKKYLLREIELAERKKLLQVQQEQQYLHVLLADAKDFLSSIGDLLNKDDYLIASPPSAVTEHRISAYLERYKARIVDTREELAADLPSMEQFTSTLLKTHINGPDAICYRCNNEGVVIHIKMPEYENFHDAHFPYGTQLRFIEDKAHATVITFLKRMGSFKRKLDLDLLLPNDSYWICYPATEKKEWIWEQIEYVDIAKN